MDWLGINLGSELCTTPNPVHDDDREPRREARREKGRGERGDDRGYSSASDAGRDRRRGPGRDGGRDGAGRQMRNSPPTVPRLRLDQLTVHENRAYDDEVEEREMRARGGVGGRSYDSDYYTSSLSRDRRGRRTSVGGGSSSRSETSDWESNPNSRPPRHTAARGVGGNHNANGAQQTPPSVTKSRAAAAASKAAQMRLYEEDEQLILDNPNVADRLRNTQSGSWTGAGTGGEAAAQTKTSKSEEMLFGLNVVVLPHAWYIVYWDVFMMFLLFFIIFWLPYEAAFVESYSTIAFKRMTDTQKLFMISNRIMDALFGIDLLLQFVLGYVEPESQKVITNLSMIRMRYIKSYFLIDILSLFPFDQVVKSSSTKLLRAIKFLRMLKLLRAMKANRIMARLLSHVDISNSIIKVFKDCVALTVVIHFLVCAWAYQANGDDTQDPDRWIFLNNVNMLSPTNVYITVIQLLFTSDVQVALISDMQLKIVSSVIIYVLTAFTIAELTDMVSAANAGDAAFTRMLDELNYLMRERNFPNDLRYKLRDFLRFKHDRESELVSSPERQELMRSLSPQLQVLVANQLSQVGLKVAPMFHNCRPSLMMQVTMASSSVLLGATEGVMREGDTADHLYVLEKGFLISAGRVVQSGAVFGQECLVGGGFEEVMYAHSTHTLTFSSITRIHVHQLDQIIRKADPNFWHIMRRRAKLSLLMRGIVMYTQLAKRRSTQGPRATKALAQEMTSMGVGKVVIYRMLLAYRYVNGESGKIERASRRIQSWYRGQRVRNCLRLLVFRVRMRSSYIPPSLRNRAQRASEFEQMMRKLQLPGMDGGLTGKVEMLQHKVEENMNQVRMLIVENRRMARTIDSMALLLRKMTLGIS